MPEPNWLIASMIGALLGYFLPYIVKGLFFIIRWFRHDRLEGKWFAYHTANKDGICQVVSAIWTVRKGFNSKFIVQECRQDVKGPMYKGVIYFERNFWLARLNATKHDEEVLVRFLNPITTQDTSTWGLYLGIDFHGRPVSGPIMLSRKQLSEIDALKVLTSNIKHDVKSKLITA